MRMLIFIFFISTLPAVAQYEALPGAHAHNDYEHDRPLHQALEAGFTSIEADIHLLNDTLYIAHDADEILPGRTLESLYLNPLKAVIDSGNGYVFKDSTSLILLIDVKTEARATYAALHHLLQQYQQILTTYRSETVHPGPVSALISGNRDREAMVRQVHRFAALDGRLSDLDNLPPVSHMPLISQSWFDLPEWTGGSAASPEESRRLLQELINRIHEEGRLVRFWAAPDNDASWQLQYDAGVDLINTDKLDAMSRWLRAIKVEE